MTDGRGREGHAPGARRLRRRTWRGAGSGGREGHGGRTSAPRALRRVGCGFRQRSWGLCPAARGNEHGPFPRVGRGGSTGGRSPCRTRASSPERSADPGASQLGALARARRPCGWGDASPLERREPAIQNVAFHRPATAAECFRGAHSWQGDFLRSRDGYRLIPRRGRCGPGRLNPVPDLP